MAVVEVIVADARWGVIADVEPAVEKAACLALALSGVLIRDHAEACVLLADDATVEGLNRQWRGKSGATNVLSFPAVAPDQLPASPLVGDIVLAYETCAREAAEQGKTLADHLGHLVVHGALHLAGHDHLTDVDADRMETLEVQILAELGVPDPYGDAFEVAP